ncbi:MAG: cobyrinate a,c-diamide synthase [Opitutales bacterium]|nr:cobyrinate a,c-diamide synthase [Opitutales bacterium]
MNSSFYNTGFILAGTQSSSGKTLLNAIVLSALKARGIACQPFKTGPDYIDSAYSERYAGKPCYNLDYWMMGNEAIVSIARHKTSHAIGVVEGVMGLFDGVSPESSEGSTYSVAQWLRWPVFLVIPAAKQGRSIRATIRGFVEEAGPGVIHGIILNKVSGPSHAEYLKRAIADLGIPVTGAIPLLPDMDWPERHLGLQASQEWIPTPASRLVEVATQWLDMDQMLDLAAANKPTQPIETPTPFAVQPWGKGKRLAIARDEAFHFYYRGNFDTLEAWGFSWTPFSPLHDRELPAGIDGLILGGGFPELYSEALARNTSMRDSIHHAIQVGLPCYAECGGFMYLTEGIVRSESEVDPMVGIVPGHIHMTDRLQHFGYAEGSFEGTTTGFPGHEFHHSIWDLEEEKANLWTVKKPSRSKARKEGYALPHLHASYMHLYFLSAESIFRKLFGSVPEENRFTTHNSTGRYSNDNRAITHPGKP